MWKCGLKWRWCYLIVVTMGRHFPCGSVDWNEEGAVFRHKRRKSLPLWKCGLKCFISDQRRSGWRVTSLVEVWIEISGQLNAFWIELSLPLWKCGLKYESDCIITCLARHFPCGSVDWNHLPPWTVPAAGRHFPCGSVDWNLSISYSSLTASCHFPCGSVDWNVALGIDEKLAESHFPCGSVDWNFFPHTLNICFPVTSLVEVWIEITKWGWIGTKAQSLPLWKCGLKSRQWQRIKMRRKSHFPCGSVDWNRTRDISIKKMYVTSLVEVWIEIWDRAHHLKIILVTSLVEVWIEIAIFWNAKETRNKSLPLWKCGLKSGEYSISAEGDVTSLVEVWIEIVPESGDLHLPPVTSLVEVWIEIPTMDIRSTMLVSHFPCGSVDWNEGVVYDLCSGKGHFPCGSVDWNNQKPRQFWRGLSHFPCGSVDWNT